MKRLIRVCVVCSLFLFSAGLVHATEKKPVFLWQIKGQKSTLYILGTVRVLKSDNYPLDARIEDAFKKSRKVVFEANREETGTDAVKQALISQGTYRDRTGLEDHVSKKTYAPLAQRMRSARIPEVQFGMLKPWLCAVNLSGLELKRLGYDPKYSLDAHFFVKALKAGKPVVFLETARQQIETLSKLSDDRQEELLNQTMRELDVIEKNGRAIESAWKNGDAGKMEELTSISLDQFPRVRKTLFIDRNARWASQLGELMKKGEDAFVVMGAGHLVGEKGVLATLESQGYTAEQQ